MTFQDDRICYMQILFVFKFDRTNIEFSKTFQMTHKNVTMFCKMTTPAHQILELEQQVCLGSILSILGKCSQVG